MTLRARRFLVVALALAAVVPLGARCKIKQPAIQIDAPVHGTFTQAGSVQVTGKVTNVPLSKIVDVTVNGVSVLPLDSQRGFSASVPLDAQAIFNPIVAELVLSGAERRDRVTVIAGDSIPDGDVTPMGVALRLNDTGLNDVEPQVTSLVDLDLSELLPPGTVIIEDYCIEEIIVCLGRVDVTIASSPEPSISDFSIDVDSMTDFVAGDVFLTDVFVPAEVTGAVSCDIDISAATTNIIGDYALSPLASDLTQVDVTQQGGVTVNLGGFSDSTDCDGLFGGAVIEALIDLFVGDIQDLVQPELENFLNTPDAQGNTPVAGAIESALAEVEISGPIGEAIGVGLETPLFDVFEDGDGITLDGDARITAAMPHPDAVDLAASYHVPDAFPSFGPTTPDTGTPYDLAIAISNSGFNQLLKAETESGLLLSSLTEISLGGGSPQPLTAGLLASFIPAFSFLDASTPLRVDLKPTLAPVVSGEEGPGGEIAEIRASHLLIDIVDPTAPDGDKTLIQVALDARLGLSLGFQGGELSFDLSQPTTEDVSLTVLQNEIAADEAALENLLTQLIPLVFPSLADSLGTFPLPNFLGLELGLVEVGKSGEFLTLFLDLSAAP